MLDRKKYFYASLIAWTACSIQLAQAQIDFITQYPKSRGYRFYQLIASNDTIIATTREGDCVVSTDRGRNWTRSRIDTLFPQGIALDSNKNIWSIHSDRVKVILSRSTDFGLHWKRESAQKNKRDFASITNFGFNGLNGLYTNGFTSTVEIPQLKWKTYTSQLGRIVFFGTTGWGTSGATLYRSTDIGRSWRIHRLNKKSNGAFINFFDSLKGQYIDDSLYWTTDGGKRWNSRVHPASVYKFYTISTGIGFFSQQTYLTTDTGSTWRELGIGIGASFFNDRNGYIWDGQYLFARTSNGGITWDTIFNRIPLVAQCGQIHMAQSGVGLSAIGKFGQQKIFLATTNFGDDWFSRDMTQSEIPQIFNFKTDDLAYGVGLDSSGHVRTLLRAELNGLRWNYVADVFRDTLYPRTGSILTIQTITDRTIAIITDSLQLFLTTDEGKSWKRIQFTTWNPMLVGMVSVFFLNASTGYVSTYNELFKTTDGGDTWLSYRYIDQPNSGISFGLKDLSFVDERTGYGITSVPKSSLYKTTNGGVTWFTIIELPSGGEARLRIKNAREGIWLSDSQAAITRDSGKTWSQYTFGREEFQDVSLLNDTTFWTGSISPLWSEPGTIRKATIKKSLTSVRRNLQAIVPRQISSFPNPVMTSEVLTILVDNTIESEIAPVALRIIDVLGRNVHVDQVLIHGQDQSRFIINVKSLSPGIYFFHVAFSSEKVEKKLTGKFVIGG